MSHVLRKSAFCICENKDADQLRSYSAADQHLCFRYIDSATPPLPKSQISSLFVSDLVRNPEDRYSRDVAQINQHINLPYS